MESKESSEGIPTIHVDGADPNVIQSTVYGCYGDSVTVAKYIFDGFLSKQKQTMMHSNWYLRNPENWKWKQCELVLIENRTVKLKSGLEPSRTG